MLRMYNVLQPYRTTPLVLPGAKIKKDAPLVGECYLRHHPNPMMRAAPHHFDTAHPDVAMKQRVCNIGNCFLHNCTAVVDLQML